jgi:DNA-binding beta-propeller fold protein YncE
MTEVYRVGGMSNPHGTFVSPNDSILYVTSQIGNTMYKVYLYDPGYSYDPVTFDTQLNAHEIIFSPDGTKYFLSCETTEEVRVYSVSNDQLLAQIPVGKKPQEFSISEDHHWLFVSCTEDVTSPGCSQDKKGSVYIIDYTTNAVVSILHPGYQPHGIAVDDDHDVVYVANLNYDGGPAPHHVSACGGRNGYISIIDMSTQQLLNVSLSGGSQYVYKNEVLQFPYFVAYRK